jgi:hypothetical protein
MSAMHLNRTTPLLVVDAIEPMLPLFRDQLGYAVLAEVPHGAHLGFTLLARDDQQVMLQTRTSLLDDCPEVAALAPSLLLYTDVDSLDEAMSAMAGAERLIGPRTTFYGAREAFFKLTSGHVVAFAEPAKTPAAAQDRR